MGLIFQFGELLPELDVVSNVALPLRLSGMSRADAGERALVALERVDMAGKSVARIDTLSGGETQRAGIARAVVTNPPILIADEPTGALDLENSVMVTELLIDLARTTPAALLVATHDPVVFERLDHRIDLREFAPVHAPGNLQPIVPA